MNKDNFKKGIEDLKKISMTNQEKSAILSHILERKPITGLVKSPWTAYSFHAWFQSHKWSYAVLIVAILMLTGGGVTYAAKGTLPGDLLYPVRVNIVEPVYGSLLTSRTAKAKWESDLATERMKEAETLAQEGKLDQPKQAVISALLAKHTRAFSDLTSVTIESIASSSEVSSQIDNIKLDFKAKMGAHAKLLEVIAGQNLASSSEKVAVQNLAAQASMSAGHDTGDVVVDTRKAKEAFNKSSKSFENHKKMVEDIINTTQTNLVNVEASTDTTPLVQSVASTTDASLNQARQYLDSADQQQNQGNDKGAKTQLINSEQQAKEASIILDTGVKLEKTSVSNPGRPDKSFVKHSSDNSQ